MLTSLNKDSNYNRRFYSQYYTRNDVSSVLIQKLGHLSESPKIIDLSMGEGSLLHAARAAYPEALLYGCDIDANNVKTVAENTFLKARAIHIDSTSSEIIKNFESDFDLIIGNPPFGNTKKTTFLNKILDEFSCNCSSIKTPLELIFLLIGIKLLKDDGVISYIVPDGLLTNKRLEPLREFLYNNYTILSVTYLGKKRFERTEACTHILTIRKKKLKEKYKIKLESTDHPLNDVFITKEEFVCRADYSFHTRAVRLNATTLKNLEVELIRGKIPKSNLKSMDVDYLHTTSFTCEHNLFSNDNVESGYSIAKEGDILIARVGTRSVGKIGCISRGSFYISDCVIIIRANSCEIRDSILSTLKSPFGKSWLKSISKGVGAKHITMSDLKELPVFI
ncbi:Eco57I restriction-modification methylase domain-containing protein [Shewanella algae]|uniref:Eco57I restriction-modification methylase domain-containing protein n=1 Tax=Shewanella algae TaxID=38313 RepID=UPI001C7E282C|nr:N-6 DNA methylase [Shewanella algae]